MEQVFSRRLSITQSIGFGAPMIAFISKITQLADNRVQTFWLRVWAQKTRQKVVNESGDQKMSGRRGAILISTKNHGTLKNFQRTYFIL